MESIRPQEPKPEGEEGVDLNRGKRKLNLKFVQKNGIGKAIPYHFIDDIAFDHPHYKQIVITFIKSDKVTVTLKAAEGGTLRPLFKRIDAGLAGMICERDGLQAKAVGTSLEPDGDEFAVAEMIIDVKKG